MKGREFKRFKCWFKWGTCAGRCPGCQLTFDWNLWRKFCDCGAPATGYRVMSLDADVEFFCDEHFQDVPQAQTEPVIAEGPS